MPRAESRRETRTAPRTGASASFAESGIAPSAEPGAEILVALSGGIDSAVSAWLLREAGYRPRCVFLKNWDEDDASGDCTFAQDYQAAQSVADFLGLPLHLESFSLEYYEQVFTPMVEAYRQGRTPNPDLWCNQVIKFDALAQLAGDYGCARFATGHYARSSGGNAPSAAASAPGAAMASCGDTPLAATPAPGSAAASCGDAAEAASVPARPLRPAGDYALLCARDARKDQTYFLSSSPAQGLARCEFPIGGMTRAQVRRQARELGLPNAERKGTSGICFIGPRDFRKFLGRHIPPRPGDVLDWSGRRIGGHMGAHAFTPGQRRGLGVGGVRGGSGQPWYVACSDVRRNLVLAVQGGDSRMASSALELGEMNWIGGPGEACAADIAALPSAKAEELAGGAGQAEVMAGGYAEAATGVPAGAVPEAPPDAGGGAIEEAWLRALQGEADLRCRIRHGGGMLPCRLLRDGGGRIRVELRSPEAAVAPGQQCALYLRGRCLGGGEILDCDAARAARRHLAGLDAAARGRA